VATIGPASSSAEQLVALVEAGMDVARFGFAHGSPEALLAGIQRVREASERCSRPVAVLADLPGPKIRTGAFAQPEVLQEGSVARLVAGDHPSSGRVVAVDYTDLLDDIAPGDRVCLGDGEVVLRVEELRTDSALARVEIGGRCRAAPAFPCPQRGSASPPRPPPT